jgi:hypothetical protein
MGSPAAALEPPPINCTNRTRPNRIPTQISRLFTQGLAGFFSFIASRFSGAVAAIDHVNAKIRLLEPITMTT